MSKFDISMKGFGEVKKEYQNSEEFQILRELRKTVGFKEFRMSAEFQNWRHYEQLLRITLHEKFQPDEFFSREDLITESRQLLHIYDRRLKGWENSVSICHPSMDNYTWPEEPERVKSIINSINEFKLIAKSIRSHAITLADEMAPNVKNDADLFNYWEEGVKLRNQSKDAFLKSNQDGLLSYSPEYLFTFNYWVGDFSQTYYIIQAYIKARIIHKLKTNDHTTYAPPEEISSGEKLRNKMAALEESRANLERALKRERQRRAK